MMYLGENAVGISKAIHAGGIRQATATLTSSSTSITFSGIESRPYGFIYAYEGPMGGIENSYMMIRGAAIIGVSDSYVGQQYAIRGGTTYSNYNISSSTAVYDSTSKTFTLTSGVNFKSGVVYKLWYFVDTLD